MDAPAYYATPAVTRYFDHIQHLQPVTEARTILSDTPFLLKEFDLAHMPALERKVEVKEKKAKKEGGEGAAPAAAASAPGKAGKKAKKGKEEPATETAAAIAEPAAAASEPQQGKKKEKKEKAPPAPAAPSVPMPSMIDLRVGKVLEGESRVHPAVALGWPLTLSPGPQSPSTRTPSRSTSKRLILARRQARAPSARASWRT